MLLSIVCNDVAYLNCNVQRSQSTFLRYLSITWPHILLTFSFFFLSYLSSIQVQGRLCPKLARLSLPAAVGFIVFTASQGSCQRSPTAALIAELARLCIFCKWLLRPPGKPYKGKKKKKKKKQCHKTKPPLESTMNQSIVEHNVGPLTSHSCWNTPVAGRLVWNVPGKQT